VWACGVRRTFISEKKYKGGTRKTLREKRPIHIGLTPFLWKDLELAGIEKKIKIDVEEKLNVLNAKKGVRGKITITWQAKKKKDQKCELKKRGGLKNA